MGTAEHSSAQQRSGARKLAARVAMAVALCGCPSLGPRAQSELPYLVTRNLPANATSRANGQVRPSGPSSLSAMTAAPNSRSALTAAPMQPQQRQCSFDSCSSTIAAAAQL